MRGSTLQHERQYIAVTLQRLWCHPCQPAMAPSSSSSRLRNQAEAYITYASAQVPASVRELAEEVEVFAKQFPTIGFEKGTMRYKQ